MRVLVAGDAVGGMSALTAGEVIGRSWAGRGADVAVVPLGASGGGFVQAVADLWGAPIEVAGTLDTGELMLCVDTADTLVVAVPAPAHREPGLPLAATSAALGVEVARLLAVRPQRPARVVLDLGGLDVHDGGAGLLAGFVPQADPPLDEGVVGLTGVTRVALDPVRELLEGMELVGVVPAEELDAHLLGLRGITSVRGHAGDVDPALLLATDAALAALASACAPDSATMPGSGACGGVGQAVLALGGRVISGPAFLAEVAGLGTTLAVADLVITHCDRIDFGSRGGEVPTYLAAQAATALVPCVVVAGAVAISARELRLAGFEAAHAVRPGLEPGDLSAAELAATAERVAASWLW